MNEAWAAVIAAIAAGIFGMGGVFAGLVVGRRQTTDQAHIEHGQWLREQRLQAYTEVMSAWHSSMEDRRALLIRWEAEAGQGGDHLVAIVEQKRDEGWRLLRPAVQRVNLLGPGPVTKAADDLVVAWRGLWSTLKRQVASDPPLEEQRDTGGTALALAYANLHFAALAAIRTPPSPGGEPPP